MSDERNVKPADTHARWWFLFGVALLALLVDQATKAYVVDHLNLGESWMPVEFIRPVFKFTLTHNTGAAFGMFKSSGPVFSVIALIVSGIIIYYYRQLPRGAWVVRFALGLMLAGALGNNVIDRFRQGYVVDFLHVSHFPIFNVADSCIVVGVSLLLATILYEDWRANRDKADANATPNEAHADSPGETLPG